MARKPTTKNEIAPAPAEAAPAAEPAAIVEPAAAEAAEAAWGANPDPAPSINTDLLRTIVDATKANSFVYAAEADYAPLVAAGYAEVNPGMVNDNGGVATRATTQGISFMSDTNDTNTQANADTVIDSTTTTGTASPADPTTTAPAPTEAAVTASPIFKASDFADIFAGSPKRSGGGRESKHDFDKLEVGDFFVVAATTKMPDPKKSLASTISSAERRYATEQTNDDGTPKMRKMKVKGVERDVAVYTKVREFESRSIDDGARFGPAFAGKKVAVVRRTK